MFLKPVPAPAGDDWAGTVPQHHSMGPATPHEKFFNLFRFSHQHRAPPVACNMNWRNSMNRRNSYRFGGHPTAPRPKAGLVDFRQERYVADERLCNICNHFSPALTCIEKPTWGRCMRLAGGHCGDAAKGRSLFTWADNVCDKFQPRGHPVEQR
jgi:hypothetical protein